MGTRTEQMNRLDAMLSDVVRRGLGHHTAEDDFLDGRCLHIAGAPKINFGSCSYLGLEMDPRVKQGAVDAVVRYGTQLSSSRAYLSLPLYRELESLFRELFGAPALVAPTTTLAHLAALPVLVEDKDAVILDHQVHQSVQLAAGQLRLAGVPVELLHHERFDELEDRVAELSRSHPRVWYMADGVYSMYGDLAPIDALAEMLDRHPALHLYIDDAHGMSWRGPHGRGYTLERIPMRERLFVATSLAKGFGVGGGVLLFPEEEQVERVKRLGGPMIFSGPIQPPSLGAALASARIHLSPEIEERQAALLERIRFCNALLIEAGLPLVSRDEVPIRYVGVGEIRAAGNLVGRLLSEGLYTNLAMLPAVPMKRAGVRFMLTLHHSPEDIARLVDAFARHLPKALAEEGSSLDEARAAFELEAPAARPARPRRARSPAPAARGAAQPALSLQHETTIRALDPEEWDRCLGRAGTFTWDGLCLLEEVFRAPDRPENRWDFHYYVVRERSGRAVLATFFTDALWKDDMLAPDAVSREVEARRRNDPRHMTSRVFGMGSLLTEGAHLYLDRSAAWREALGFVLDVATEDAERSRARMFVLRDFSGDDLALDTFFEQRGLIKAPLPDSMILTLDWRDDAEFLARLSKKKRYFQRTEVLPWERAYDLEVVAQGGREPDKVEWDHLHRLYLNVKRRSFELNTFDLPENLLPQMLHHPSWELLLLRLRPEFGGEPGGPPVGFAACFRGPEQYAWLLAGLDYRYVASHRLYRQCMLQTVRRARAHGARRLLLGMGTPLQKSRFGAARHPRCLYVRAKEEAGQA